jgi:hypothetical protein
MNSFHFIINLWLILPQITLLGGYTAYSKPNKHAVLASKITHLGQPTTLTTYFY